MRKLPAIICFVVCMTAGHLIARTFLNVGLVYLLVAPAIGFLVYVVISFIYLRIRLGEAGMQRHIDEGNLKAMSPELHKLAAEINLTAGRELRAKLDEIAWNTLLMDDDCPLELKQAVRSLLIPRAIDPERFGVNLVFLENEGEPSMDFDSAAPVGDPTPSAMEFERNIDRPVAYPTWFLAGFPDVASWLSKLSESKDPEKDQELVKLFTRLDEAKDSSANGFWNPAQAAIAVDAYVGMTKKKLECAL